MDRTVPGDDEAAYRNFMENHPQRSFDAIGRPRWEGSAAEALLKQDMDEGYHLAKRPFALYDSRPEYKVFDLDVFRGHIDQEIRLRNYLSFLKDKEEALQQRREKAKANAIAKANKEEEKKAAAAAMKAAATKRKK